MTTSVKILFIALCIIFWAKAAQSQTTYYVSPTGNNTNPGTITQPFATLQRAHDIASPGDTIYMRGGTYQFTTGQALTRDGASGNPIKVFAYPGELPVLDGINMTQTGYVAGFPLSLRGASWWHIRGLEIKNGPSGGLVLYEASNNNIIEQNNIHHNGRLDLYEGKGVVAIGTGANNLFLNNDSHHNRDQSANGGNADGFQIALTGSGNVLRGNRAWRNSDDGFDFFNIVNNSVGGAYVVENNWAWENGYDNNLQALGNGTGFKLGGSRSGTSTASGGHTVRNNVAWKNRTHAFYENSATVPMVLYNNMAWNNGGDNYLFQNLANVFHNNIDYVNGQGRHINSASDVAYNSWTLPVNVSDADFVSLNYSGAAGPRHADGSLPTIDFLRLAPLSDLIDKGVNVGIRYSGSAPDLGAFEFVDSALVLEAPTNLRVQ